MKFLHVLSGLPVELASKGELVDEVCETFNALTREERQVLQEQNQPLYLSVARLATRVEMRKSIW